MNIVTAILLFVCFFSKVEGVLSDDYSNTSQCSSDDFTSGLGPINERSE